MGRTGWFAGVLLSLLLPACQPKPVSTELSPLQREKPKSDDPVAIARRFILETLYPGDQADRLDPKDRRFAVEAVDLNPPGEAEIILTLPTTRYCGSGGCRFWILSADGALISSTSVADFPLSLSQDQSKGWHDLITWSNRAHRLLRFDGEAYPRNASTADTLSADTRKSLEIREILVGAFETELQF